MLSWNKGEFVPTIPSPKTEPSQEELVRRFFAEMEKRMNVTMAKLDRRLNEIDTRLDRFQKSLNSINNHAKFTK